MHFFCFNPYFSHKFSSSPARANHFLWCVSRILCSVNATMSLCRSPTVKTLLFYCPRFIIIINTHTYWYLLVTDVKLRTTWCDVTLIRTYPNLCSDKMCQHSVIKSIIPVYHNKKVQHAEIMQFKSPDWESILDTKVRVNLVIWLLWQNMLWIERAEVNSFHLSFVSVSVNAQTAKTLLFSSCHLCWVWNHSVLLLPVRGVVLVTFSCSSTPK